MRSLKEIQDFFAGDPFTVQTLGTEIREAGPGYAVCAMPLKPMHFNVAGIPHGGAVFSLGDFAFGVAANGFAQRLTISLQHDITYLTPARGKELIATARCIKGGHYTGFYTVEITDDMGTNVAHMTVNGFTLDQRVTDLPAAKRSKKEVNKNAANQQKM